MTFRALFSASLAILLAACLSACGGGNTEPAGAVQLKAISVSPANARIANNSSTQFAAVGIYDDNATRDLTGAVTWQTSDPGVVTVSDAPPTKGQGVSTGTGAATISATYNGVSGSATVAVTPATLQSLAITPVQPSIARGTKQQFTATGTYSDNSVQDLTASVSWTSSNPGAAAIGNTAGTKGLASAVSPGVSTISATSGGVSATTTLTVTPATLTGLAVTPVNPSIPAGLTRQFAVTGTYSDNSTQDLTATATWSSSNTSIVRLTDPVAAKGSFSAVAVGTATITAASGSLSSSTTVTVTPATLTALAITPANPSIARGTSRQFTATGTYSDNSTQNLTGSVAWSSSNTGVATISNASGTKGLAASVATGSTVITAAIGAVSATTSLTVTPATLTSLAVTPANPSIARGTTRQFTATGTYSDGSTQNLTDTVTWSSSSTGAATISNAVGSKGLATSVAAGSTVITAASGGVSATTSLTVTPATLTAIAVTPANPSVATGATAQFTATGTYSDGSTQNITASVTWSVANGALASVSNASGSKGLATGIAGGATTVAATLSGVSGSTGITVLAPTTGSIALAWDAATTYSDGSPITDVAGYKVYYGTSPGSYSSSIDVGNVTTYTITNLPSGVYYVAVTVRNLSGSESPYSNEVSKTVP
jgi:hypothetical protein